jgi:AcrR family transcriptional regulator
MEKTETPLIRKPVQARGIARYEKILDAAEELIIEVGVDDVSSHMVARRAGVSASSVYQYFPTRDMIFLALSERHFNRVVPFFEERIASRELHNWDDMITLLVVTSCEFYNEDVVGLRLFLGVHTATMVRNAAASRVTRVADELSRLLGRYIDLPPIRQFPEKLAIALNAMDGVFIRSIAFHGIITPDYCNEALRVVMGYLNTYLLLTPNSDDFGKTAH